MITAVKDWSEDDQVIHPDTASPAVVLRLTRVGGEEVRLVLTQDVARALGEGLHGWWA